MPKKRRDRRDSQEIWAPALLAAEGPDDCYFFDGLRILLGIPDTTLQIETFGPDSDEGGKDHMPDYLNVLDTRHGFSGLQAFGVVRDADTDAATSLSSVAAHLHSAGFIADPIDSVHSVVRLGMHPQAASLSVGVFIMPDGTSSGALEDLYTVAIREESQRTGDLAISCVDDYLTCLDPQHLLSNARREKMRLYAWLASRERPSVRPGQALHWKYVDFRCATFERACRFVQDLVGAASGPESSIA